MRIIAGLVMPIGCGLLSGCDTLDSVGESLSGLLPASAPPAPAAPLWVEQAAPAAGGVGALCVAKSTTCTLDPPLAIGAQCTCANEGALSVGVAN